MGISEGLYLIDVLHSLDEALVGFIFIFVSAAALFAFLASEGELSIKKATVWGVTCIMLMFSCIFVKIAIPSKETMRQIMIVETVTDKRAIEGDKEVYEWVKEEIKIWDE